MHIDRRNFIQMAGIGALGTLVSRNLPAVGRPQPAVPSSAPATGKPDILVIMTDQWNPRNLGYESDPDVHTPNLDALAAQSVNFTNCYTTCPVCMPARASFISGLYPHDTRLWSNSTHFYMPPSLTPLFADMKRAGYTTSQIGKFHWWSGNSFNREFDSRENYFKALGIDVPEMIETPFSVTAKSTGPYSDYLRSLGKLEAYSRDMRDRLKNDQYIPRPSVVEPEQHNDWFVGERSIELINRQSKDKPYFLVTSFPGPHTPLDAMGRYANMYPPERLSLAPNVQPVTAGKNHYSLADLKKLRANYLGKITLIDDCIGRLIRTLKERGTYDNTLIFFTADHGEMMGSQSRLGKTMFWEESARVPMLVKMPGQSGGGQRNDAMVQWNDVYATSIDIADGTMSATNFSRSLLPLIHGEKKQIRQAAFSEIFRQNAFNYMVRENRYKWFIMQGEEHLYDLQADPFEMENLIASAAHRDTADRMRERLRLFLMNDQLNEAGDYKPLSERVAQATRNRRGT